MKEIIELEPNITIGYMKADRRENKRRCIKPECTNEADTSYDNYQHIKKDHAMKIEEIYKYLKPLPNTHTHGTEGMGSLF